MTKRQDDQATTEAGSDKQHLSRSWANLSAHERRVFESLIAKVPVSRDTNLEHDKHLTFGERLSDRIAAFVGSWPFIILFSIVLVLWIVLNSVILARSGSGKAFDPYPYILLNLMLSMVASMQAPLIMMSQNRQAIKDRLDAAHDYEVNLKAELEIVRLHEKIDELRQRQWEELVQMQQEQIRLLTSLQRERGQGSDETQCAGS